MIQTFLDTALLTPVIVCIIFFSLLFIVFSYSSLLVFGYSGSIIQETKTPISSQTSRDDQQQQQPNKVIWNLEIYNSTSNSSNETTSMNNNYTANFLANFTMVKPDGSLSHGHIIKNFTSENVILTENDIVVTGITDISSNGNTNYTLEYNQVPITIHLMGKKVLGLMIDAKKTGRHFASSNELFGTLISGTGLEDTELEDTELLLQNDKNNNNTMEMNGMTMMHHS